MLCLLKHNPLLPTERPILKSPLFILLLFWGIALAAYYPTAGAGFVTDVLGWFESYDKYGWNGIAIAFSDHSLHYVYHFFGFLLYKIFGWNGYGWYASFTLLHACVGTLGYSIFSRLLGKTAIPYAQGIAFIGSLLFILSPYQTEVLVWYACSHYLLCSILVLLAMHSFLSYLQEQKLQKLLWFYTWFMLSVFTLEISFCFPLFVGAFIALAPNSIVGLQKRIKLSALFVAPAIAIVVVYFLLSKFLKGSTAGHYGTAVHFNLSPALLAGNFSKYCLKLWGLSQFYSHSLRMHFYSFFEKPYFLYIFISLATSLLAVVAALRNKLNDFARLLLLFFAGFIFVLAPVVNLYFTSIIRIEGDRFSYLPSLFAYATITLAAFAVFRKAAYPLLAIYLLAHVYCLQKNTSAWHSSCQVSQSLQEDFKWNNAPHIYMLNLPDNFDGAYMFRGLPPDNFFAKTVDLKYGKQLEQKCELILQYNMNFTTDSFTVEKIDENKLQLKFAQYGAWWWLGGIGAANYDTENYAVNIDEWGTVIISFKKKIPGAVYLYQCGTHWKQVQGF